MKNAITYLIIGIGTLTMIHCKKSKTGEPEVPVVAHPVATPSKIEAMFKDLATPTETFSFDASESFHYTCHNGTRIMIYPNAFMTADYKPVSGTITVSVKDILSKKDMITNNALPVSNGSLLVSGGELYFSAVQGNTPLRPNPDNPVYVSVPTSSASLDMRLFTAVAPADLSAAPLNWQPNNSTLLLTSGGPGGSAGPGGPGFYGYDLSFADSVKWTNCDYFYNTPGTKTTCQVVTNGMADRSNTVVYLSMNGKKVLCRLTLGSPDDMHAFISYSNSIPVGADYTIAAMCYDGNSYFYASKQATMTENMVVQLPALVATGKTEILNHLATLP